MSRPAWIDGHTSECHGHPHSFDRFTGEGAGSSCNCGHSGRRAYEIPEGLCGGELLVTKGEPKVCMGNWRHSSHVCQWVDLDTAVRIGRAPEYREAWERLWEREASCPGAYSPHGDDAPDVYPPPDGRYWMVRQGIKGLWDENEAGDVHQFDAVYYELVRQDAEPLSDTMMGLLAIEMKHNRSRSKPLLFISGTGERYVMEASQ